jgi:hypothetical protein
MSLILSINLTNLIHDKVQQVNYLIEFQIIFELV